MVEYGSNVFLNPPVTISAINSFHGSAYGSFLINGNIAVGGLIHEGEASSTAYKLTLPSGTRITRYALYGTNQPLMPSSFRLEGSSDGTNFSVLHSYSSTALTANQYNYFDFSNTTAYKYYKAVFLLPTTAALSEIEAYTPIEYSSRFMIDNQYKISTFNEAAKCPDCKAIYRLKLKRRTVVAGVDTYDANWMTISSYVVDGGIGNVIYGVDDQDWLQGVTRIGELDLELNNIDRKFNERTDVESLWYDSVTSYYIPNSLVELEYGFEYPTGTQIYANTPFHSGMIISDSISYDIYKNTFKTTISSKLEYFKKYLIKDAISFTHRKDLNAIGFMNHIKTFMNANTPTTLGMTITTIFPQSDLFYKNYDTRKSLLDFFTDVAKDTNSIFGMNRNSEIFMTYYNCPYYANTCTTIPLTGGLAYYSFNDSITTHIVDKTGNLRHLSLTVSSGGVYTGTTGKFGSNGAMFFVMAGAGTSAAPSFSYGRRSTMDTFATSTFSVEALCRINSINTWPDYDDALVKLL